MRGNFVDLPTDCPQRDERLGWTGDVQIFAPTASYLYDCAGLLVSWLRDLSREQLARPDRTPPLVVPNVIDLQAAAAGWGDATVIVPWVVYQRFGDAAILHEQFPSMVAWLDGVAGKLDERGLWTDDEQFGDWLDPNAPPDEPSAGKTEPGLVATAYLARSAELLSMIAKTIGLPSAVRRYADLADRVRLAFAEEYTTPTGRLSSDSQTAFALAVEFGLLETPEQRQRAGRRLAELVRAADFRIGTGFVGTPLIADALCTVGESALAYRLLLERDCPSFLYPVTMGATTMWERWDSMLPDGTITPSTWTSFNHCAPGAVADWLHRTVGGLAPGAPGYRHLVVAPQPGGGLTKAATRHETPYGEAKAEWRRDGRTFFLTVTVPPNCTASVRLPGTIETHDVGSGTYRFTTAYADLT